MEEKGDHRDENYNQREKEWSFDREVNGGGDPDKNGEAGDDRRRSP